MNDLMLTGNNALAGCNDLFLRWISYLDVSEKTAQTYTRSIRQFGKYLSANNIFNPERDDIISFRDSLKESHKPSTVQSYMVAVKLFFSWAEQEGIYRNIAVKVKGAKLDREHKKDYLTAKQAARVLQTIERKTLKGKRDYAVLAVMLTTGLRTIEVCRANVDDLRTLGDSTVLYVQGKGHDEKGAYVKIADHVDAAIRDYLSIRGRVYGDAPLFASAANRDFGQHMTTRSVSRIVKTSLIEAGYNSDRLTAHSMRHTAATLNLLNGGSMEETQQLLRHSNINTTMIYAHALERAANNSEERVADAIFA